MCKWILAISYLGLACVLFFVGASTEGPGPAADHALDLSLPLGLLTLILPFGGMTVGFIAVGLGAIQYFLLGALIDRIIRRVRSSRAK